MVPIEALFFEDGLPGIVRRGVAPEAAPAAPLGEAELVSRGEHLCQIADDLEAASSPTQRDLRLHALTGDLRALSQGTTGELGARLLEFSDVAAGMLEEGLAARISHAFAERLRAVGEALRAALQTEEGDVAERVEEATAGLRRIKSGSVAATTPIPVAEPEDDIVPIESLAPDDLVPEPHPAPRAAAISVDGSRDGNPFATLFSGSGASAESGDLAGSYVTFGRLLHESSIVSPSLDGLMGRLRPAPSRPTAGTAVPPARHPAPQPALEAAPMIPAAAPFVAAESPVAEPEVPVVEIAELCYRGRAALQRAAAIKIEIRGALEGSSFQPSLEPLVAELLDLVELALIE
jgi:hypothetical protein